ncbi:carboxypeptidase B [Galendromus occidentalis]|uniref:Carboxypeptidase B n=1 Tax=Galendromus occidentalis TaxID=34638 RepID=A0AAJ6VVA1_9ACAR|nr:carboxypeptidase B [Galendromus occidentalis]
MFGLLITGVFFIGVVGGQQNASDASLSSAQGYEGSKVFSSVIANDRIYHDFLELRSQRKIAFLNDLMREKTSTLYFLVLQEDVVMVGERLQALGIPFYVVEEDLQSLLARENGGPQMFSNGLLEDGPFDLISYPSYAQILKHIDFYVKDPLRGKHVSKFIIGESYQGRPIVGVRFNRGHSEDKAVIFFECGIHPREWISITTCAWMIHEFSSNAAKYRDILDVYEVRIVPSANPDGYEYTKTHRFWRGNLRPSEKNPRCKGVDINRNFDVGEFCGPGTSQDPCNEEYCGDSPFSEPESHALKNAILVVQDRLHYYISLHAYGQLWMYPHSYTTEDAKDHERFHRKASAGARAIREMSGKNYTVGPIAQTLYAVTGSSVDWAYEHGARNAFVIELPPTQAEARGAMGFIVMPDKIQSIAQSTFHGIRAMIKSD